LLLHYQPKIRLHTHTVEGAEALVRWLHPRKGMISPGNFIGLAEDTGLIKPLTLWTLQTALLQCRVWRQQGLNLSVSVNLAAEMLKERDLPEIVASAIASSDVLPNWLTVELTEGAVISDFRRAVRIFARLRDLGVRISIDDFGMGYSSLVNLRDLPIDEVKIDRSFVQQLIASEKDGCIVRSVIELGQSLGWQVVAEGVEDEATAATLTALGCDFSQGFHYTPPLPATDFAAWLARGARVTSRVP
jgi:EAL domain-containing protein (putative c-di-GMP-specific phosphodiesterase class I)